MSESNDDQGRLTLPYMVRWFSPTLLANAAIRAAVSPVFGTFADARSVQANVDGFETHNLHMVAQRYDLSEAGIADPLGVVWVDYLADTGDGFDSTYAMASLVAQETLTIALRGAKETITLPAGKVLILGGDQVYPYPSRDEYRTRFEYPFKMAFSDLTLPRMTFVIPGNHDWYDGLNSFDYLFCQARYGDTGGSSLGSLNFTQHRSYFAIRLPYNWWIWGGDIQFSDYLDAGQTRYFQTVAELMHRRARLAVRREIGESRELQHSCTGSDRRGCGRQGVHRALRRCAPLFPVLFQATGPQPDHSGRRRCISASHASTPQHHHIQMARRGRSLRFELHVLRKGIE